MIEVSKIGGETCIVNADAIDLIETIPDTVLVLASGKKLLVLDPPAEIVQKIIEYKKKIFLGLPQEAKRSLE
jgi:flagellar protein FlbD